MTIDDILFEIGASDIEDAKAMTRYAIAKQVPVISEIETQYGLLCLAPEESGELRVALASILERRLARLREVGE